jgi:hypothetical protein
MPAKSSIGKIKQQRWLIALFVSCRDWFFSRHVRIPRILSLNRMRAGSVSAAKGTPALKERIAV